MRVSIRPMSLVGQKRPKLPWLPAAKSTTKQRLKFVPEADVAMSVHRSAEHNRPTLRLAYMNWGLLNGAKSPTMIVLAIWVFPRLASLSGVHPAGERELTRAAS